MLSNFENKIIDIIKDENVEYVFIVADEHIFFKNTNFASDYVDAPISKVLNGSIIIHNHPIFIWKSENLNFKNGFSVEDVLLGIKNKCDKIVLVEKDINDYCIYILQFNNFFNFTEDEIIEMIDSDNFTQLWSYKKVKGV